MALCCPSDNSTPQQNLFHGSILRIRSASPRSARKTANAEGFLDALKSASAAVRSFSRSDGNLISVSHLEMFLPDDVDSASLKEARAIVGELPVFWEAPPERAEQTIALIAGHNSDEATATFGYKLRTGGVTADAFPTSAQIARALVTAATHQLPIKFTAGLHHPIRQFRDEVKTKMHGFLNVLGAAVTCGGASMGGGPSRDDARGRRSALVYVYRRFLRLARLENRYGAPATPAQIREVFRQLQLR